LRPTESGGLSPSGRGGFFFFSRFLLALLNDRWGPRFFWRQLPRVLRSNSGLTGVCPNHAGDRHFNSHNVLHRVHNGLVVAGIVQSRGQGASVVPDDQRAVAHAQHTGFGEHNLGNLIRAPNLRAHGCPLRTDLLGNRRGRLRGFGLGFRRWFGFRLKLLLHHGFGRWNRFGFWGLDLCHFGFGFWSSRCLRCSLGCFPRKTLGFPLVDPTTWRGRGCRRRRRWR